MTSAGQPAGRRWFVLGALICASWALYRAEPAFFFLVAFAAAAVAPPFGGAARGDGGRVPRGALVASSLLVGAVFFLQSAHRHWTFASGAKDLGLFYQTHWLISRGLPPFNTVMDMHALADHMELVDFLIAPWLRLYEGPEVLLLVQAAAAASAMIPVFGLGRRWLGREDWGLAAAWVWALSPDVHSGILFDYNPTMVGTALLLWTAWALVCRRVATAVVFALLTCACKENVCLYVMVLGVVLAATRVCGRRGYAVAGLALAVFVLEIQVVTPWFREDGFRHWDFDPLGRAPSEIAANVVRNPVRAAGILVDHEEKRRGLLQPLATTGYLGLAEPASLILLAPNWAERFLASHRTRWWGYYYGAPAAAMAVLGMLMGARRLLHWNRLGRAWPAYALICAALVGLVPPYPNHDGGRRSLLYHWGRSYASPPDEVRTQQAAVAFIGPDPRRKVAAQYHLLPHLAGRPFVVTLDRAHEADFVALHVGGGTSPERPGAWRRRVRGLWESRAYHVGFCEGRSLVLVRGSGESVACAAWEELLAERPEAG